MPSMRALSSTLSPDACWVRLHPLQPWTGLTRRWIKNLLHKIQRKRRISKCQRMICLNIIAAIKSNVEKIKRKKGWNISEMFLTSAVLSGSRSPWPLCVLPHRNWSRPGTSASCRWSWPPSWCTWWRRMTSPLTCPTLKTPRLSPRRRTSTRTPTRCGGGWCVRFYFAFTNSQCCRETRPLCRSWWITVRTVSQTGSTAQLTGLRCVR